MRFVLDDNVADSVRVWLRDQRHDAVFVRDLIGPDAQDAEISVAMRERNWLIFTHDRDFRDRQLRERLGLKRRELHEANRIVFVCEESRALKRLKAAYRLIIDEIERYEQNQIQRVFVEIKQNVISVKR